MGKYEAVIYKDDLDHPEDPNRLVKVVRTVTSADTLHLDLASGGGQVIWLRAVE